MRIPDNRESPNTPIKTPAVEPSNAKINTPPEEPLNATIKTPPEELSNTTTWTPPQELSNMSRIPAEELQNTLARRHVRSGCSAWQIVFIFLIPIAAAYIIGGVYPEFINGCQQRFCKLEASGLSKEFLKQSQRFICSDKKKDTNTAKSISNFLADKTEDIMELNRQFSAIPDLTELSKTSYRLETLANKIEYFTNFTEPTQIISSLDRLSEDISTIVSNFVELRVESKHAVRNILDVFETVLYVLRDYQKGQRSMHDLLEAYENALEEITEHHLGSLEKITIAAEYAVLDAREESKDIMRRLSKQKRIIRNTEEKLEGAFLENIWPWEKLDSHQKNQLKLDLQVYEECDKVVGNVAESTYEWRVMVQEFRTSLKHAKSNMLKVSDSGISLPEQIAILGEKMNALKNEVHRNRHRVKGG